LFNTQRQLVGDIISRFEKRGYGIFGPATDRWTKQGDSYKLAAIKLVTPSKEHLEKHYEDLSDKPFFKSLVTCKPFS
jgi:nucleoside-diphosphate kinase